MKTDPQTIVKLIASSMLFLLLSAHAADQYPPSDMTFQGFLTDASTPPVPLGNTSPVNKQVTFRIWNHPTIWDIGYLKWAETQIVTVDKGHFSVLLGKGSPLPGHPYPGLHQVFVGTDASDRWISLEVDGAEIKPRTRFFAAPYAHVARTAHGLTAGNHTIDGQVDVTGVVNGGTLRFRDRTNGQWWDWWANGGNAYLYSFATEKQTMQINQNGAFTAFNNIMSAGSVAGLSFQDRSNNNSSWQWYSEGGSARLWNGADKISVHGAGEIHSTGLKSWASINIVSGNLDIASGNLDIASGNLAATGSITSRGSVAGLSFQDRSNNNSSWQWYSEGGSARLWNGADKISVHGAGEIHSTGLKSFAPIDIVSGGLDIASGNLAANGAITSRGAGAQLNFEETDAISTYWKWDAAGQRARLSRGNQEAASIGGDGSVIAKGEIWSEKGGFKFRENDNWASGWGWLANSGRAHLWWSGSATYPLTINHSGFLGIGIADPKAPLHVKDPNPLIGPGTREISTNTGYGVYLGSDGGLFYWGGANGTEGDNKTIHYGALSAIFEEDIVAKHIWSGNTLSSSDARAKLVKGTSESSKDLEKLRDLTVRDYSWIDRSIDGHRPHKKLVAQEVEAVFPQAVRIAPRSTAIPNIYEVAKNFSFNEEAKELRLTVNKPHDLVVGDQVDIYTESVSLKESKVIGVTDAHTFIVHCKEAPESVFVYGKYVDDFRTVDYEAIAMLNVSATQELARQTDALQRRISELDARERRLDLMEKRLSRLEGLESRLEQLTRQLASEGTAGEARLKVSVLPQSVDSE